MPSTTPSIHGDQAVLAQRYVRALYALAEQDGSVDTIKADMENLRALWRDSAEWRFVAADPRLSSANMMKAAAEVARMAEVSPLTAKFLAIVAENRRLALMPALVGCFFDEVDARRGEFRAEVRSARTFTSVQLDSLSATLASLVGGKVHMAVVEDASLIGGFTVKMGAHYIDASVKSKLEQLERTLTESGSAA